MLLKVGCSSLKEDVTFSLNPVLSKGMTTTLLKFDWFTVNNSIPAKMNLDFFKIK